MFKGVLRCYEGKRKVTIKVIDFSKNFQFIQKYGGDPDNLINVVINNPVN